MRLAEVELSHKVYIQIHHTSVFQLGTLGQWSCKAKLLFTNWTNPSKTDNITDVPIYIADEKTITEDAMNTKTE